MGKLIVIEGIDGVGKATQTRLLAKRLRAQGRHVTVFASPCYDLPTGKLVRRALSGEFGDFVHLSPYISALPYLLDFAAWRGDIVAALKKGDVVCDRYVQSTIAYHSAKSTGKTQQRFLKDISQIAFESLALPAPHRVVLLDVPVMMAQHLMRSKKKDQYEKDTAYQKRVARMYALLAKDARWRTISCVEKGEMLSRSAISEKVWKAVR